MRANLLGPNHDPAADDGDGREQAVADDTVWAALRTVRVEVFLWPAFWESPSLPLSLSLSLERETRARSKRRSLSLSLSQRGSWNEGCKSGGFGNKSVGRGRCAP